jgi:hypothetical protein
VVPVLGGNSRVLLLREGKGGEGRRKWIEGGEERAK